MKKIRAIITLICTLIALVPFYSWAQNSSPVIECDRDCLYALVDQYMDALVKDDPASLPLADVVKFTENNVQLKLGDGLWNTISSKRGYDLKMADAENGQVGWFAVVEEHGHGAIMSGRMKVEEGKISEVETIVSRKVDDAPYPVPDNLIESDPVFSQTIPLDERIPRARLISIADGYFDTLQLNDGTMFTQFHDDCDRVENGLKTTNTFVADYPVAAMGCADQFKIGQYVYDDRLRDRRYHLVDEEKGLVFAAGFIDHTGSVVDYTWVDGTEMTSLFHYPHSFVFLELFKIDHGKIRRVEAVFAHAPYHTPSVWLEK